MPGYLCPYIESLDQGIVALKTFFQATSFNYRYITYGMSLLEKHNRMLKMFGVFLKLTFVPKIHLFIIHTGQDSRRRNPVSNEIQSEISNQIF